MRWADARTVIHDAFAMYMTKPDAGEAGATRLNLNGAICHGVEAGLVLAAVDQQKLHLRATAIYMNAPDGWITGKEVTAIRRRLWLEFCKANPQRFKHEDAVVGTLDTLIYNYRRTCQNPAFWTRQNSSLLVTLVGDLTAKAITPYHNQLWDLLARFDNESLQPVWAVIHKQRGDATDVRPKRKAARAVDLPGR